LITKGKCYGYGVKRHFQQYFSNINGGQFYWLKESGVRGENHRDKTNDDIYYLWEVILHVSISYINSFLTINKIIIFNFIDNKCDQIIYPY
jgi:hypothetical protein